MAQSKITITRKQDFFAIMRELKVFVNGKHVGNVRWDNSNDFSIAPGTHQLYVKMDWCQSEPINIDVGENEVLKYEVTLLANESKFGVLKQLYDLVFNFSNFFKLEKNS
jgi:hypothetical protein